MEFASERKHFLYLLTRAAGKIGLGIFFQRIDVQHAERIPEHAPAVFVANHPNSIMDALVLGVAVPRKVNYIAHAGLFRPRLVNWFLRSCGVIPVHRRQDEPGKMERNAAAFQACYETLERGETIGIFPEGTSDMLRKVKQVKTGAARIVLETESRNGYDLGVKLIPLGLHFFSRSRFRSRVLVNVGDAIPLVKYFTQYNLDPFAGVAALTREIQARLEKLTVNIRDDELDEFVRNLEHIYREELKNEPASANVANPSFQEFFLTQKIADCVQYYQERDPGRLHALRDQIEKYQRKVARLRLRDEWLRDQGIRHPAWLDWWQAAVVALLGFPVALYGIVNHALPYFIAESAAKRFLDERTKILTALLLVGGSAFLFFYAVQIAIVFEWLGWTWATVYAFSLPLSGFWALFYVKRLRRYREQASISLFWRTNRDLIQRLRLERQRLITMMHQARDEFLAARQKQKHTISMNERH
ncbi:MAG: 1-acyl-sn-glycerol-3-phosphate acyltransferase [bacterium]